MRIYHLDLKLSMFTVDYIQDWFCRLHANGYGGVVVEVDNKLRFPSSPELAAPDALSSDEWRSLVRYARGLGMVVYPLVQTLGHMEHVLIPGSPYESLSEIPGDRYLMCPQKEGTIRLVKALIHDVWEAFDRPERIHLGGDECSNIGSCPRCRGRNTSELLAGYMAKLVDYAGQLGMQPEFWADMALAFPRALEMLPGDIRWVDWFYGRRGLQGRKIGLVWGARFLAEHPIGDLKEHLPEHLKELASSMVTEEGLFDNFYGARYLKEKGYDVVIASGVRLGGDSNYLPRTSLNIANVGASELACRRLGCDHMVTSWAVRMAHPETTWPGMLASDPGQAGRSPELIDLFGDLDMDLLCDMDKVQSPFKGLDFFDEKAIRFERPCYGGLLETIVEMSRDEGLDSRIEKLVGRVVAGERILKLLKRRLQACTGEKRPLRHWIMGVRMGIVKSDLALCLIEVYRGGLQKHRLSALLEEYASLMEDFTALWRESVTKESLGIEHEVKFFRDMRVIKNLIAD